MKKLNYLFLVALSLAFVACEDDSADAVVDTEDPDISLQAPTGTTEVFADDDVNVRASVTDNLGLETVTISVTPPDGQPQVVHTEEIRDFLNDETTAEIDENISLGTGSQAAGDYIITVRAVDERGNDAEQSVTISVVEADNENPTVAAISSPTAGLEVERGQDITISSSVEDNRELDEVRVTISSGGNDWYSETFDEEDFGDDQNSFTINETVTIPDEAPLGTQTLTIEAEDRRGNVSTSQTVNFSVTQASGE